MKNKYLYAEMKNSFTRTLSALPKTNRTAEVMPADSLLCCGITDI